MLLSYHFLGYALSSVEFVDKHKILENYILYIKLIQLIVPSSLLCVLNFYTCGSVVKVQELVFSSL